MTCLCQPSKFPKKVFPFWENPVPKSQKNCLCKLSNNCLFWKSHMIKNQLWFAYISHQNFLFRIASNFHSGKSHMINSDALSWPISLAPKSRDSLKSNTPPYHRGQRVLLFSLSFFTPCLEIGKESITIWVRTIGHPANLTCHCLCSPSFFALQK